MVRPPDAAGTCGASGGVVAGVAGGFGAAGTGFAAGAPATGRTQEGVAMGHFFQLGVAGRDAAGAVVAAGFAVGVVAGAGADASTFSLSAL